ncbi:uncharacterized protein V1513DRAFT_437532 [Lipomyces chichibuensis]|uniref:uncharacterized protein n=1 Tax=Lipomyces chichibuensis TaxID=1546026 RepID=UPI00334304CD
MRPVVSLGYAWCCTVLSVFGIIILCAIAGFFLSGSEAFLGSTMDPPAGQPVAANLFGGALIYAVFLAFCGCQIVMHRTNAPIEL